MILDKKETLQKILELLEENPVAQVAFNKVDLKRATFYRWLAEDKEYQKKYYEAIKIGNHKTNDFVESKLLENIQNGEQRAIEFYLTHKHSKYKNINQYLSSIYRLKNYELEKKEATLDENLNQNTDLINNMINEVKNLTKEKNRYEMLTKKLELKIKKSQQQENLPSVTT